MAGGKAGRNFLTLRRELRRLHVGLSPGIVSMPPVARLGKSMDAAQQGTRAPP